MERNNNRYVPLGCLALVFIIYSMGMFLFCSPKNATMWIGYGFSVLAFLLTGGVMWWKLPDPMDAKDLFYQAPTLWLCAGYDAAAVVISILAAALRGFAIKWVILVELAAAALFIIAITFSIVSSAKLLAMRADTAEKAIDLRALESRLKTIAGRVSDGELAEKISRLAEDVRFSDLAAGESVQALDRVFYQAVSELEQTASAGDTQAALAQVRELDIQLKERNRKCRLARAGK